MTGDTYTEGQAVFVRCIGVWYAGVVRKVTPKRVMVDFTTGSGKRRWKLFSIADAAVRATAPEAPLGRATRFHCYRCGASYRVRLELRQHEAACGRPEGAA